MDPLTHKCRACYAEFNEVDFLKAHLTKYCGKQHSQINREQLSEILSNRQSSTRHKCKDCGRTYIDIEALNTHISKFCRGRTVEKNTPSSSTLKPNAHTFGSPPLKPAKVHAPSSATLKPSKEHSPNHPISTKPTKLLTPSFPTPKPTKFHTHSSSNTKPTKVSTPIPSSPSSEPCKAYTPSSSTPNPRKLNTSNLNTPKSTKVHTPKSATLKSTKDLPSSYLRHGPTKAKPSDYSTPKSTKSHTPSSSIPTTTQARTPKIQVPKMSGSIESPVGNFKCDICGLSFKRVTFLDAHITKIHLNKTKSPKSPAVFNPFMCEDCGLNCMSRDKLESHRHNPLKKEYICTLCKTKFPQECSLSKHHLVGCALGDNTLLPSSKKPSMDTGKKLATSQQTNTVEKTKETIVNIKTPAIDNNKKANEDVSTKTIETNMLGSKSKTEFNSMKVTLKIGKKGTTIKGKKVPYQKNTAGSTKKFISDLNGNFKCDICGLSFKRVTFLNAHRTKVHQNKISSPKFQAVFNPYMCEDCGLNCMNEAKLESHRHNPSKKEYICTLCKTKFPQECSLSKHHLVGCALEEDNLSPSKQPSLEIEKKLTTSQKTCAKDNSAETIVNKATINTGKKADEDICTLDSGVITNKGLIKDATPSTSKKVILKISKKGTGIKEKIPDKKNSGKNAKKFVSDPGKKATVKESVSDTNKPTAGTYPCTYCSKSFNMTDLLVHLKVVHNDDVAKKFMSVSSVGTTSENAASSSKPTEESMDTEDDESTDATARPKDYTRPQEIELPYSGKDFSI